MCQTETGTLWWSKVTLSWWCVELICWQNYKYLHLEEKNESRYKVRQGNKNVHQDQKSKREENQPFSVSGQRIVSITLQGKICSKRFPPAKGDQMLHKNRNNQKIFSRKLKRQGILLYGILQYAKYIFCFLPSFSLDSQKVHELNSLKQRYLVSCEMCQRYSLGSKSKD